jgi:High potential iron-sulfur protein
MKNRVSRRILLRRLVAAVPILWGIRIRPAAALDPAPLDVKDPAAVQLGYVEDAARVDIKKYPTYAPGVNCANCLQLQGNAGEPYRPCLLFPGKLVNAKGWCAGWTPEI